MAISQATQTMADGTVAIAVTVPFIVAPTPDGGCSTTEPNALNLQISQFVTGGSLAGGHNYYYLFVAIDSLGLLSPVSPTIEVIVPSETDLNVIEFSGITPFDANAAQYNVYRAVDDPQQMFLIQGPTAVLGGGTFSFTDTGIATSNVLPPDQQLAKTRVYWRLTGTTIWNIGAETQDRSQTSLTFYLPVNVAGQSIDVQLRSVSSNGTETPEIAAPTTTYTVTGVYPSSLSILAVPSASPIKITARGSIPPSLPAAILMYTSTTTSVTLSWAMFTIYYSDNTSESVPAGNITITGLSPGTTYYFYLYWDEASMTVQAVTGLTGSVGSPAIAFTAPSALASQAQNLQGHTPFSTGGVSASTPSSGTGGGGTGGNSGGCVRSGMVVESRTRGVVPIETVEVGEWLKSRHGWTKIVAKSVMPQDSFVRLETLRPNESVEVSPTHPMTLGDESCLKSRDISLGNFLIVDGGYSPLRSIVRVDGVENGQKVRLTCEPEHEFFCGTKKPLILVHNLLLGT